MNMMMNEIKSNIPPVNKREEKENDPVFDEIIKNMNVEDLVKKTLELKLEGNEEYKIKNFENAINKYNEGIKYLNKIEKKNDKIDQLEIALYLNLSLCFSYQEKFNDAYDNIMKVLKIDKNNEKALFRLCQIEYNRCNFDIAKDKVNQFLRIHPDHIEAKKLLKNIIIKETEHNRKQKEAYSKIFEKASGLYDDREKEIMMQKKKKYEEDMNKRKEKNEQVITFDQWEELENERRKKEDENRLKEQEKRMKENEKNETKKNCVNNTNSIVDIDEEDQKIIDETKKMGYCYFKKDIKEEDKKLFEKNIPIKIQVDEKNIQKNNKNEENKAISSWNAAGTTYEEKDMTKWVKNKIQECLENMKYFNENNSDSLNLNNDEGFDFENTDLPQPLPIEYINKINITEINDLTTDAQIVVIRGTKRHIFEISCNINVTIYMNIKGLQSHKVIVQIKELSSELEAGKTWKHFINIKKNDKLPVKERIFSEIYELLTEEIEKRIKEFTIEYKKM